MQRVLTRTDTAFFVLNAFYECYIECCSVLEHHGCCSLTHVLLGQIFGQSQTSTSRALQRIWLNLHPTFYHMPASDFMNDEEGVQELCRQAARWLFGYPRSLLPRSEQASHQAASQDSGLPSADRLQVRCFCSRIQLQFNAKLPAS